MSNDFLKYFFGYDKDFNYYSAGERIYNCITSDDGTKETLILNVAGFSKKDIKLERKKLDDIDYLYIIGTPSREVKDYIKKLEVRFSIKSYLIDRIDANVENGLLLVDVYKKDIKPDIKINF